MAWSDRGEKPPAEGPTVLQLLLWLSLAGWVLGLVVTLDYMLRPDTFPVKRVNSIGPFQRVDEARLAEAVTAAASGNFFTLDLNRVSRAAETVPWVHRAQARRVWPDAVIVEFSEQQLVARWNEERWVNAAGEVADLKGLPGPEGLPRLRGPEGMQAAVYSRWQELDALVAPLERRVAEIRLTARHSWVALLDNGLTLLIGREAPAETLARFVHHHAATVAPRVGRVRLVDLRYTNGFAVEWRNGQAPGRSPSVAEARDGVERPAGGP